MGKSEMTLDQPPMTNLRVDLNRYSHKHIVQDFDVINLLSMRSDQRMLRDEMPINSKIEISEKIQNMRPGGKVYNSKKQR